MQDHLLEEYFGKVMSVEQISDTADAYAPAKEVLPNKARSWHSILFSSTACHGVYTRLFKLDSMMTLNNHEFACYTCLSPFSTAIPCESSSSRIFLSMQLRECGRGGTTCCLSSCALRCRYLPACWPLILSESCKDRMHLICFVPEQQYWFRSTWYFLR